MKRSLRLPALLAALVAGAAIVSAQGQIRPRLFGVWPAADALFDDASLHEIRLVVNSGDWQSLKDHFLENTYYPADLRWRDHVVRNVGIRSRGTGSRSGTKPGLRVDFDRYSTDQKFLGLKSVILRNNTQDPSGLHERLSMPLFRRMGLPAPREAHTTLYVNNEYVGLYTIVETVDKAFLKRNLGEDEGYLYEFDSPIGAAPYNFEYRGSDPGLYVPLPFQPETHESDPRPEYIERFVRTINETSGGTFRNAIAEYVDLTQYVRYVAVEMFLADNDGMLGDWGVNNFYMYRFDGRNLFAFVAWDKSEAFKGGPYFDVFHNIAGRSYTEQNRLMARALSYSDLSAVYAEALRECARIAAEPAPGAAGGAGWLEREVRRQADQTRAAAMSDPVKPFTNADWERAIDDLIAFGQQRSDVVSGAVQRARVTRRDLRH